MTIEFHENAAARFNELAQELLGKARTFPPVQSRPSARTLIHPVARLSGSDVIGTVAWKQCAIPFGTVEHLLDLSTISFKARRSLPFRQLGTRGTFF